jgi:hypothetical protein
MFPSRVLEAFHETLAGLPEGWGIRIRLRCDDAEMARWPWELLRFQIPPRRSPRYLLRDDRFSLVRVQSSTLAVEPPKERLKLTILAVDATRVRHRAVLTPDFPEGLPEMDAIDGTVMPHPTRRSIDEFIDEIVEGPQALDIFHFTGHGTRPRGGEAGALVLHRDDDRGEQTYPGDELAAQLDSAGTSLAFVNACYSDDRPASGDGPGLSQSLAGSVPVVLAMRGAVGDDKARYFAGVFYEWLLAGSTVDEAVTRGRLELDESDSHWQRAVLYCRASTGRFLEPATPTAEQVQAPSQPLPQPAPDAIRRWAMASNSQGHWQLVPGNAGPEFRRVDSETAADVSHLRMISASLVLSSDARVAAELSQRRLALAWVDRVLPRLVPWPEPFELSLDEEARLLAVAVDYGEEVVCLLSTARATYRVDVSPTSEPVASEIFGSPSRCATIVADSFLTVDEAGQVRGWELNLRSRGIARVNSLDAARSAGRVVYAVAGHDDDGRHVVAWGGSMDTLAVLPDTPADEVVVVRQLASTQPSDQVLLRRDGQLQRIPVDSSLPSP